MKEKFRRGRGRTPKVISTCGPHGRTKLYVLLILCRYIHLEIELTSQSCMIDILTHLPHSPFSRQQLDLLLWLLETNNVPNVPSKYKIMKSASLLHSAHGIRTLPYLGAFGNLYYVSSIHWGRGPLEPVETSWEHWRHWINLPQMFPPDTV